MAKFRAMMLWTDSWIADTSHLTRKERGTYMDLLILMWRTPRFRVPNDDAWLAKKMKMSMREVEQELRPIILEFCKNNGNWITQKRLRRESRYSLLASARHKALWQKKNHGRKSHVTVTVPVSKEEGAHPRAAASLKNRGGKNGKRNGKMGAIEACDQLIARIRTESGMDHQSSKNGHRRLSKR